MRAQPFRKQQKMGRLGEAIICQLFPAFDWVSKDPDESTDFDFRSPQGEKIEVKTCTTYPRVYINERVKRKNEWSDYGPKLSLKKGVDFIYYVFLNDKKEAIRIISIKPTALLRAMKKTQGFLPLRADSNKETKIYNVESLLEVLKKGVSYWDIPIPSAKETAPYAVILDKEQAKFRELWLKRRREGVGCSDVYTLTGKSKWKTVDQLLDEKVFGLQEEITDVKTLQRFWWGHALEPVLTQWWNDHKKAELGEAVEWQELLRSTHIHVLQGTPDAFVGDKLIEYKTTSPRTYTNVWGSGRRVPESVYYQVQAQMALTGMDPGYVVVLRSVGIAPKILKVEKDIKIIDSICYSVEEFWKTVLKEREKYEIP